MTGKSLGNSWIRRAMASVGSLGFVLALLFGGASSANASPARGEIVASNLHLAPGRGEQPGNTNGCSGVWWNTAFNGTCNSSSGVTQAGYYWVHATCAFPQPTIDTKKVYRAVGFKGWVGAGQCRINATSAEVMFSGTKP